MPLLILSYAVQIGCAVHALKRGYPIMIVILILSFPFLGSVIYIVAVLLPELKNSRAAAEAQARVADSVNPNRQIRYWREQVEISDNVENKLKLAEALMDRGRPGEAYTLLYDCAQGPFKHAPEVLLPLARAAFAAGRYGDTLRHLDDLKRENPDHDAQDTHLLYARALESSGQVEAALEEYGALSKYYNGYEARCRFAALLKLTGRVEEADAIFTEIIAAADRAPGKLNKLQADWIAYTRRALASTAAIQPPG